MEIKIVAWHPSVYPILNKLYPEETYKGITTLHTKTTLFDIVTILGREGLNVLVSKDFVGDGIIYVDTNVFRTR